MIDMKDVKSWSVELSVDDGATATIELDNSKDTYFIEDLLFSQVGLNACVDNENIRQFTGFITGLDATYAVSSAHNIAIKCSTWFSRLNKKPINTENFGQEYSYFSSTATTSQIITEILTSYCGYVPTLIDTTNATNLTYVNLGVNGDSLEEQLRLLAEASLNKLFVNSNGTLILESIVTSPTIHAEVPYYYSTEASSQIDDDVSFSVIRVRGGYFPESEDNSWFLSTFAEIKSPSYNCSPRGVTDVTDSALALLGVDSQSLLNAEVNAGIGVSAEIVDVVRFDSPTSNGYRVTIQFIFPDGSGFCLPTGDSLFGHIIGVVITPKVLEIKAGDSRFLSPDQENLKQRRSRLFHNKNISRGQNRSLRYPDEKESLRYDIYLQDFELSSKIGIVWDEYENIYINSEAQCYAVAQQKFIELKQLRKEWQVTLPYNSLVQLNKLIRFTAPDTNRILDLIVTKITVEYNADNSSLMMTVVGHELCEYVGNT